MPTFRITHRITGTVWVDVETDSLDAAKQLADAQEHDDPPPGHLEWDYAGIYAVEEVR